MMFRFYFFPILSPHFIFILLTFSYFYLQPLGNQEEIDEDELLKAFEDEEEEELEELPNLVVPTRVPKVEEKAHVAPTPVAPKKTKEQSELDDLEALMA